MRQIDPRNLNTTARAEYDQLKRLIYRGVCETVMASLQHRSHRGEALRFGDGIICWRLDPKSVAAMCDEYKDKIIIGHVIHSGPVF
jgi:hypothetical protein